jgi:hypothetical protein
MKKRMRETGVMYMQGRIRNLRISFLIPTHLMQIVGLVKTAAVDAEAPLAHLGVS